MDKADYPPTHYTPSCNLDAKEYLLVPGMRVSESYDVVYFLADKDLDITKTPTGYLISRTTKDKTK